MQGCCQFFQFGFVAVGTFAGDEMGFDHFLKYGRFDVENESALVEAAVRVGDREIPVEVVDQAVLRRRHFLLVHPYVSSGHDPAFVPSVVVDEDMVSREIFRPCRIASLCWIPAVRKYSCRSPQSTRR